MKFYEVQQALEEGKKIRRSDMNGYLIFEDRYEAQPKIRYVLAGSFCSLPYHIGESELLADDWEIIEEATIKTKTIKYITCPKCKKDLELTDIHVYRRLCGFCNTNIELKNEDKPIKDLLAEAKALTGMSKSIDMSIDFSKFPDHTISLWYKLPSIIKS